VRILKENLQEMCKKITKIWKIIENGRNCPVGKPHFPPFFSNYARQARKFNFWPNLLASRFSRQARKALFRQDLLASRFSCQARFTLFSDPGLALALLSVEPPIPTRCFFGRI